MENLIFLTEKRDGSMKVRTCADGSTRRAYTLKEEAASATAATDSILLTGAIKTKQNRDVMTLYIPNAFVQNIAPQEEYDDKIIMKIRGVLVDMILEIIPETYLEYVFNEGNSKVLYVKMEKALYRMMIAPILYYNKFQSDIKSIGYKVNPYDAANKIINGRQHTITWHVDDVKTSHVDPKVNDEFHTWRKRKYGINKIGYVTTGRGKKHDYFAINLDYSEKSKLKIDM